MNIAQVVPDENLIAYQALYSLEVGLRELIIASLSARFGPKWWKQRIPADVKDTAKGGIEAEKSTKWSRLIPYHPIYYSDFPDLKKIITKGDNWRDVFKDMFEREEILVGTLSEIEPVRNKIAHNRKLTDEDLSIIKAAYKKIESAVGSEKFQSFVVKCTVAEDIPHKMMSLQAEADQGLIICQSYKELSELPYWDHIKYQWWFDSEYFNHEIEAIKDFFRLLYEYSQLPRHRGQGHRIEMWVKSQNIEEKYTFASQEFSNLLMSLKE